MPAFISHFHFLITVPAYRASCEHPLPLLSPSPIHSFFSASPFFSYFHIRAFVSLSLFLLNSHTHILSLSLSFFLLFFKTVFPFLHDVSVVVTLLSFAFFFLFSFTSLFVLTVPLVGRGGSETNVLLFLFFVRFPLCPGRLPLSGNNFSYRLHRSPYHCFICRVQWRRRSWTICRFVSCRLSGSSRERERKGKR